MVSILKHMEDVEEGRWCVSPLNQYLLLTFTRYQQESGEGGEGGGGASTCESLSMAEMATSSLLVGSKGPA